MAGYTRQSSGSIVAGLTIRAADINAEFNALRDAFDAATGHAHDGTTGDAPEISLTAAVTGTLPIASGGTNATTASAARTSLGLVISTDVQAWDAQLDTLAAISDVSNLSDISALAVTDSLFIVGDGANYVAESGATARTSLGLGSIATQNSNSVTITGGSITAITDLTVGDGGTGASNASGARTNLGLVIGTNVQAEDAGLTSIAGLTTLADRMIYTTASDVYAVTTLSSFGRTIIDDANAAAVRTTIGSVIGTNVQAHDAQLDDIAALAVTDGNFVVGNGTAWVAESGATARTSLGLTIGTNVQAWDAQLDDIAALAVTNGNFIVGDGTNWVAESGATAKASMGVTDENIEDLVGAMVSGNTESGITVTYDDILGKLDFDVPPSGTAVDESDYDAATILVANTDNTPVISTFAAHSMLIRNATIFANATVGTNELIGRSGSGDIDGLSASTARTVLGLGTAALVDTGTGASNVPTITQADGRYFRNGVGDTLGVGNTHDLGNSSGSIHIKESDSGLASILSTGDNLILETSADTGISILSGTSSTGNILFGDSGDADAGAIKYSHSTDALTFRSGGSDRMTLDAGLQMGSPTGGDKGAGSINASAIYVSGTSILTAATTSAAGHIELATTAETNTGTDTTRAVVSSALEDTRKRLKGQSTSAGTTDTLVAGDAGTQMIYTAATAVTVSINNSVHTADDVIFITQRGAGQITIAGNLTTKNSADSMLSTRTQNSTIGIKFISATEADIFGDLV